MAYGIEVFNSSGVKVLELSNRVARFVANGQATTGSGNTVTVSISGMQNNDSWLVIIFGESSLGTVTKSTGSFTISAQSSGVTFDYWVVRT